MIRTAAIMGLSLAAKGAHAVDTASPNNAIAKPQCNSSTPVKIRYASSSERLYLESADGSTRGGCVTLRDIWESRGGKAPLYAVDRNSGDVSSTATGTWLLTESLYVQDGITLQVRLVNVTMRGGHRQRKKHVCDDPAHVVADDERSPRIPPLPSFHLMHVVMYVVMYVVALLLQLPPIS